MCVEHRYRPRREHHHPATRQAPWPSPSSLSNRHHVNQARHHHHHQHHCPANHLLVYNVIIIKTTTVTVRHRRLHDHRRLPLHRPCTSPAFPPALLIWYCSSSSLSTPTPASCRWPQRGGTRANVLHVQERGIGLWLHERLWLEFEIVRLSPSLPGKRTVPTTKDVSHCCALHLAHDRRDERTLMPRTR